ncbi:hypothetical protein Y032_0718g1798 [Ancylostoma ceylanicum]|uniref:Uncharacterized protein n=1 Tax=Ancylostoma ceylanicum TaxID=53326 RepID=A0A016WHB6_9BILA|nr:hypothetical protein Y032_0718g1798 [Ancylostoma ceylanicum]
MKCFSAVENPIYLPSFTKDMRVVVLPVLVFCVLSSVDAYCWEGKGCLPPKICVDHECVGRRNQRPRKPSFGPRK